MTDYSCKLLPMTRRDHCIALGYVALALGGADCGVGGDYLGGEDADMNYKLWLRSFRHNPFHPRSERVMRRRIGRWIRRWEKRHGERSRTAKQFGGRW